MWYQSKIMMTHYDYNGSLTREFTNSYIILPQFYAEKPDSVCQLFFWHDPIKFGNLQSDMFCAMCRWSKNNWHIYPTYQTYQILWETIMHHYLRFGVEETKHVDTLQMDQRSRKWASALLRGPRGICNDGCVQDAFCAITISSQILAS